MIEYFVIGILTVLIIALNVFWANVVLKLANRVMSRDYKEFREAEKRHEAPVIRLPLEDHDPDAERQSKDLNSLMGLI